MVSLLAGGLVVRVRRIAVVLQRSLTTGPSRPSPRRSRTSVASASTRAMAELQHKLVLAQPGLAVRKPSPDWPDHEVNHVEAGQEQELEGQGVDPANQELAPGKPRCIPSSFTFFTLSLVRDIMRVEITTAVEGSTGRVNVQTAGTLNGSDAPTTRKIKVLIASTVFRQTPIRPDVLCESLYVISVMCYYWASQRVLPPEKDPGTESFPCYSDNLLSLLSWPRAKEPCRPAALQLPHPGRASPQNCPDPLLPSVQQLTLSRNDESGFELFPSPPNAILPLRSSSSPHHQNIEFSYHTSQPPAATHRAMPQLEVHTLPCARLLWPCSSNPEPSP
ncbi:hypothetical protein PR202_ga27564 [Eleusine coracana subsp. coracana]|uniref:Uncharacterized protein n=1 Tax=Eleusine coracana subsp. coracana TaxID=191504 RepID=A0AAV5DFI6_ELECO|nr:hypothetical protein PR202_ga27564 [Eleusine coracana subsp. coracana]